MPRSTINKVAGKGKKDPAKDPVVHFFNPERIPIENWNQVFKYTATSDLLNLSLVCKTFYKIIGQLPEAMEKIKLKLSLFRFIGNQTDQETETIADDIMKSSRDYTNLSFQTNKIGIFSRVLEKFGQNIRVVKFDSFCQFAEDEFIDTLEVMSKSLRSLAIDGLELIEASTPKTRTYKLTKLEKFEISDCDSCIMKVLDLLPNTLLEVSCYDMEIDIFWKFLAEQKILTKLVLHPNNDLKLLETIDDVNFNVNFKLEYLEIVFKECTESSDNFDKFLKTQAERSLKHLKLKNILFHQFGAFEFMPHLEILDFSCSTLPDMFAYTGSVSKFCCPSLKTLIVDFPGHNKISSDFFQGFDAPELIIKMPMCSSCTKRIAENAFPNLKKLVMAQFKDNSFDSVSFDKLEELHIVNLYKSYCSMAHCSEECESELDFDLASVAMKNLKVLKIGKASVSAKTILWILANLKSLKHLEIHDSSQLTDKILSNISEFFKNLQFIGINGNSKQFEKFIECLKQFPDLKYSFPDDPSKYLALADYGTILNQRDRDGSDFSFDDENDLDATSEDDADGDIHRILTLRMRDVPSRWRELIRAQNIPVDEESTSDNEDEA